MSTSPPTNTWALAWIALFCLMPPVASAQTTDSQDYFPLEVGNSWTYIEVLYPPYAPPDTIPKGTYSVTEIVTINDTTYYKTDHPAALSTTLRKDGQGRVWARLDDRDVLLFDFTLAEGDSYSFQQPEYDRTFQVTSNRDATFDVGAGHFENGVWLRFDDPNWIDEERGYGFAPGVGIVVASGPLGDHFGLYSAKVGEALVTAVESEPTSISDTGVPYVYPNPFRTEVTIILPFTATHPSEAVVFDLLGRELAYLDGGACDGRSCTFRWNASGLPNGIYYVRLRRGDGHTATLVLNR